MNVYAETNFVLETALLQEQYKDCENPAIACFLNKNSKDFDDPYITEPLEQYRCKMISRFDQGYQFIVNKINL